MHADHVFKIVDAHAGGAPSRLVLSGIPALAGGPVMDKMQFFAAHYDWIRRALVLEPRGGGPTSAIVLVPPSRPGADIGAFFMEPHGYLPMCGSDTISTVTALIETGQIQAEPGPQTTVRLDTPAGLIEAHARVANGRVEEVTFLSAPAFCAEPSATVDVDGYGRVQVDISYGGNFYAIAEAKSFGVELRADRTGPVIAAARALHTAVNDAFDIRHPTLPEVAGVTHVQFYEEPDDAQAPTRIAVVMPPGNLDRSPCGTGTTAKVATLLTHGRLGLGQPFVHQSLTGATFTGRAVEPSPLGTIPAWRVAITGSAYIIADSTIYIDRTDALAEGFQLS
jgi:proline racemase